MSIRQRLRYFFTGEGNGLSIVIILDDLASCGTCAMMIYYDYDQRRFHCPRCERWRGGHLYADA